MRFWFLVLRALLRLVRGGIVVLRWVFEEVDGVYWLVVVLIGFVVVRVVSLLR